MSQLVNMCLILCQNDLANMLELKERSIWKPHCSTGNLYMCEVVYHFRDLSAW